mmetsp:Transcript_28951/g.61165  ORF Transcript_28951/g.61165 Transcript_28951/m.61165 type:complete len:311 (+) Transcript_28951:225-1157(+)|eukprot:CAMPEP_0183740642 /NCGR_PEP_ID=MMETSP0737-20130205/60165_1 /TAXON_ID=385413 /ORGANISM="Thalassiosira miniscula, Strain CCMP1093" /LENGTH=310 /DNA_ID=CAMNT_0025975765 /DNA_START=99 /DNA_END=1031 /DNA_ORIENTATION=+
MCIATNNGGIHQTNGLVTSDGKSNKPATSSALRRMTPLILYGYAFNTIGYFAIFAILPTDLKPDPKYCPIDNPNCTRRDLFAFQIVSLVNLSFLGMLGFYSFFISKRAYNALPQTPQGRFLGNKGSVLLPDADYVNAVIVIFQGWDFIVSFFFEEHCTVIMMTHHVAAFLCGFFCLFYDFNPYYAVYFGGVSEFSSIFLAISQLFQYYPIATLVQPSSILSSILPAIETFSQAMFVITFFLFRIVGWAQKSFMFISDGSYLLKKGLIQLHSPGSGWFFWYMVTMDIALGALQVFWMKGIVDKVSEISNGQ